MNFCIFVTLIHYSDTLVIIDPVLYAECYEFMFLTERYTLNVYYCMHTCVDQCFSVVCIFLFVVMFAFLNWIRME